MTKKLVVSTDKKKLDVSAIHEYLCHQSYWAKGRTIEQVKTTIEKSMCFGGYVGNVQVAFARVITDTVAFAYMADVIVFPKYQQCGYGKLLVEMIMEHAELQTVNWLLRTNDAQSLYEKFGFAVLENPDGVMTKGEGIGS